MTKGKHKTNRKESLKYQLEVCSIVSANFFMSNKDSNDFSYSSIKRIKQLTRFVQFSQDSRVDTKHLMHSLHVLHIWNMSIHCMFFIYGT